MTLKHGDVEMKTVTLEVATLKDVKRRARDAFKGRKQGARISFATPELLFRLGRTLIQAHLRIAPGTAGKLARPGRHQARLPASLHPGTAAGRTPLAARRRAARQQALRHNR